MATFILKRNDTAPPITATLTAATAAVSITGASVRFHMVNSAGEAKVDAAANNDEDGAGGTGEVSYDWTAADTDTAGHFKAEWEVTFPDGTIRTFPTPGYTNIQIKGDLL